MKLKSNYYDNDNNSTCCTNAHLKILQGQSILKKYIKKIECCGGGGGFQVIC